MIAFEGDGRGGSSGGKLQLLPGETEGAARRGASAEADADAAEPKAEKRKVERPRKLSFKDPGA